MATGGDLDDAIEIEAPGEKKTLKRS